MCAPSWHHFKHGPYAYDKSVYSSDEEFFRDISKAYREEIDDLYSLGLRHIQFDDPRLVTFCMDSVISGLKDAGIDASRLLDLYIKTYNDMLLDKPPDLVVGVHLCRGNSKGRYFFHGGYDRIAIKLFQELNVDCYYLEYDTERAGTFEPLRHLPKNKVVVLGIVSTKVSKLEDIDELKARVRQAAELISQSDEKRTIDEALNQICISPQCGFASHSEGNPVSDDDVRKKLGLVVQTAKQIWG